MVALSLAALAAVGHGATEPPAHRFTGVTEVLASRLGDEGETTGRRVVVVTREEIEELPVATVSDLLALLPGVGLARRGARGVQGDLSLRGGTFEQAAVLVNGLRVGNSQTGHHHLDLFIPLAAVERVEVLYGPGSAVHGPDAFGGAVNVVTRVQRPAAFVRVGENHLTGGGVAGAAGEVWGALEREVHTGFRDNTEADVNQLAAGWTRVGDRGAVDLALAAGRRRFGAHRFYSVRYPDQREWTDGALLTAAGRRDLGWCELRAGLRLDQHHDDFVLDRARPHWYHNRHRTRGGLLNLALAGSLGQLAVVTGVEVSRDELESSNLGRHHRSRGAVFVEVGRLEGEATWGVQLRHDRQDPWGGVTTVAAGGSWPVGAGVTVTAHLGDSFRAPSFTELHYHSPATVGSPGLEPERGRSAEVGLQRGPWTATLFGRRTVDVVDYLLGDDGVWRAANLGRVETVGLEVSGLVPAWRGLRWQRCGLVLVASNVDVDRERSAYALAHPRVEAVWSGSADLGPGLALGWGLRFRNPQGAGSWATLDVTLGRDLGRGLTLGVEASNLLDREVEELHGVPLPGRWVAVTLAWHGAKRQPPTKVPGPR